jgi:hypothetical protein
LRRILLKSAIGSNQREVNRIGTLPVPDQRLVVDQLVAGAETAHAAALGVKEPWSLMMQKFGFFRNLRG